MVRRWTYDLDKHFAKIKDDSWGSFTLKICSNVKTKDKEFGPYEYVDALKVSEDGWIFNYNHHYININGKNMARTMKCQILGCKRLDQLSNYP
jgi:hypothetical protein